ncbi:Indoleamine 2 [Paramecium bursaria]
MINQNLFFKTWDQFKQDCLFDDKYGVAFVASPDLYDEDSIKLKQICVNLPQLIKDKSIIKLAPQIELNADINHDNIRSIIIKMGYLLNIVNSFLYSQNPIPQVLPKNLAVPLYKFSKILDVKPSMGYLLNFFNWRLKDTSKKDIQLENLECYSTFTGNRGEEAFYLTSLMADIRLAKCINKSL